MPGYEIIHVRLSDALPLDDRTFSRLAEYLHQVSRPIPALCAIQLRMPLPLSFEGFSIFNDQYRDLLSQNNLLLDGVNPIARTNIASVPHTSNQPVVSAFSYTAAQPEILLDRKTEKTFIVAGAGDLKDQTDLRPSSIVKAGETSPQALREKASVVLRVMQERLSGLEANWEMVSTVNVYTLCPIHIIMNDLIKTIGPAARHGITWSYGVPPIQGLDFEMDVRGIRKEIVAVV